MDTLSRLLLIIQQTLAEWQRVRWADLQLTEAPSAVFVLIVLAAIAVLTLLARNLWRRAAPAGHVALPAVLPVVRRSRLVAARHAAFFLFVCGVPLFAVGLADPRTAFIREEVTYPGRRIAILMLGASVDSASSLADRIRRRIEEYRPTEPGLGDLVVTASIGVSLSNGALQAELLEHADRALYSAKKAGKNRVDVIVQPLGSR